MSVETAIILRVTNAGKITDEGTNAHIGVLAKMKKEGRVKRFQRESLQKEVYLEDLIREHSDRVKRFKQGGMFNLEGFL